MHDTTRNLPSLSQTLATWCALIAALVVLSGVRAADITPPYRVTTLAGYAGSGTSDGVGEAAMFDTPHDLAVDGAGNVYVADTYNSTIRKITPEGAVTTWAGTAGVDGIADGAGASARFNRPLGIAATADGTVFVADSLNHVIRVISPSGVVSTFAGSPGVPGNTNGVGNAARFDLPTGLAYDAAAGVLYVTDADGKAVRKIEAGATVTTLATGLAIPSRRLCRPMAHIST